MRPREKKSKIANYALTGVFYLAALASIALIIIQIIIGVNPIFMIIVGIVSVGVAILWTGVSYSIHESYKDMHKLAPLVEANYKRVQEELVKIGFHASETYSSLGYINPEMRDDFGAPDNVNIELDDESKSIVVYVLSPFSFKKYSYKEIISCDITTLYYNSGVAKNVQVKLKFYDGYEFLIPISDMNTYIEDITASTKYDELIREANILICSIKSKMRM